MVTSNPSLQDAMYDASTNVSLMVYQFIPKIIGAMVVLLLGLILANWVKQIVIHALRSLNINAIAQNSQFQQFLEKAEFKAKIEEIIGSVLKWLVILVFMVAAINILGLPTVSAVLNNILAYIPRVISAIFVLGIGVLLAGIVEGLVKGAVAQFDVKVGRLLGKVASYLMVIFASMAAFNELGIAKELISILFIGLVAMLALGFGLALGLGAKGVVSEILTEWYQRLREDVRSGKTKKVS